MMIEKVKAWCEYEMHMVLKSRADAHCATTRCYGVVMFVTNQLLGYDSPEAQEIVKWWDDEMLPRFREEM